MPGLWPAMLALVQQPLWRPVAAMTCRAGATDLPAPERPDHACPPCLSCIAATDLAFAAVPPSAADATAMPRSDHRLGPRVAPILAARGPPLFRPEPLEPVLDRN